MSRLTIIGRAAVLAAIAAAAPAALRAQTPTAPKVFYACYVPGSGTVYRIKEADVNQECSKSTHVQFSWTDGNPAALSTTFVVSSIDVAVTPLDTKFAMATCPAGSQLVGGGYRISFFNAQAGPAPVTWFNAGVNPSNPQTPTNTWYVALQNVSTASNLAFNAYARCAR